MIIMMLSALHGDRVHGGHGGGALDVGEHEHHLVQRKQVRDAAVRLKYLLQILRQGFTVADVVAIVLQ